MAETIILKDAVVSRINKSKGLQAYTKFKTRDGLELKRYYTIWADAGHGLEVGDVINVTGSYGDLPTTYQDKNTGETKPAVDRSVNFPEIEKIGHSVPQTGNATIPEDWAPVDSETPF
jgi:hypothetical protein